MKKVIVLILALAMVFALAACGGSTSAAPAAEPVVLTFAAHFSNTIKLGETISKAKEILEEKSGGTMTLDMYFNEALMKQSDTFVGVGQGIADIAYIPSQNLSDVDMAGIFKILYTTGAVALSNADYYTGLSNGLVGGITNHYVSIVTYNLSEVAKYITEFGSGLEVAAETYMMNLDTWNSLTEEQQKWVTETFTEISDMMQESDAADLVADRQLCIDSGIEVYTLTDDELAAFAPYMEKVNNDWIKKASDDGWDAQGAYDYVMNAVIAAKG